MYCKECSTENAEGNSFCVKCGNRLNEEVAAAAPTAMPTRAAQPYHPPSPPLRAAQPFPPPLPPPPADRQFPPLATGASARKKSRLKSTIAIAASVVLVVAAALFFILNWRGNSDDNRAASSTGYSSDTYSPRSSLRDSSRSSSRSSARGDSADTTMPPAEAAPATASPQPGGPATSPSAMPAPAESPPRDAGETRVYDYITIAIDNPINSISLFYSGGGTPAYWVYTMIHDRLFEYLGEGQFGTSLATSWETDDFKTYTMWLRDDVYFHNGNKLTAGDVVFTVNEAHNSPGSPAASVWAPVEAVFALNDYTVQFVLGSANIDFLYNLTMPSAGILNEATVLANPDIGSWVGTGAYCVESFVSGNDVVLKRNYNYWGELPITELVRFVCILEEVARTIVLENGECAISFGIGKSELPLIAGDSQFQILPVTPNSPQGISFNMSDPIAADYNFRLAVLHAIDRYELEQYLSDEPVFVDHSSGAIWGYATEFRNGNIPEPSFDLDLARELLEVSAYNGETIELITTNSSAYVKAAEMLQYQLSAIGISVMINVTDFPSLYAMMADPARGYQMILFGLNMDLSAASSREAFYPGGAQNRMQYNNPQVTRILDDVATEADIGRRRESYMALQEIVATDLPFVNLYWRSYTVATERGVGGVVLSPDPLRHDMRYVYQVYN